MNARDVEVVDQVVDHDSLYGNDVLEQPILVEDAHPHLHPGGRNEPKRFPVPS